MVKKVLFLTFLFLLFGVWAVPSYALTLAVQLPGDPSPSPSVEPTVVPSPSTQPTTSPAPSSTVQPSPSPVVSISPVPSVTPLVTIVPSATVVASPSPSVSPQIGGVATTAPSSTPAPTSSPNPTESPTPSPTPKETVESILKTDTKKNKPIIQDIGDNAYNTLLDSPLSFLVQEKDRDYYHPHGLSASSTKFLLSSGFILSLIGLLLVNPAPVQRFSMRIKGASQVITHLF